MSRHHDFFERFGGVGKASHVQGDALIGVFNEPCARHSGGLLGSFQEVLDGKAILTEAFNSGLDLELPYLTAKDIDIRYSRHRQKTRGHAPVD